MTRYPLFFITLCITALCCWRCADTGADTFLEVNGHKLTTNTVVETFQQRHPERVDNVNRNELIKFVNEQFLEAYLFRAAGYREGLDQSSAIQEALRQSQRKILIGTDGVLFHSLIPESLDVDQATLQTRFARAATSVAFARMRLNSRACADSLTTLLNNGASFERLAYRYSADRRRLSPRRAAERWVLLSTLPPPLAEAIENLNPGQVSEPVRMPDGYHIIHLVQQRPSGVTTIDEVRDTLIAQYHRHQAALFMDSYDESLHDDFKVRYDSAGIAALLAAFRFNKDSLYLDAARLATSGSMAVVHFSEGQASVSDIQQYYHGLQPHIRPPLQYPEDVRVLAFEVIRDDLLIRDALRRGMDKNERFEEAIQHYRNERVQEQYFKEFVAPRISVSDSDVEGYYGEHYEKYKNRDRQAAFAEIRQLLIRAESQKYRDEAIRQLRREFVVRINSAAVQKALGLINAPESL